jgi:hypothetical protein
MARAAGHKDFVRMRRGLFSPDDWTDDPIEFQRGGIWLLIESVEVT